MNIVNDRLLVLFIKKEIAHLAEYERFLAYNPFHKPNQLKQPSYPFLHELELYVWALQYL